jgi:hypothetical protein
MTELENMKHLSSKIKINLKSNILELPVIPSSQP